MHNRVFADCFSLTDIEIPDNVISIGASAFCQCTNLTNIRLSNNLTKTGAFSFVHCTSLKNITLPDSITTIELGAFGCCTSLKSITIPSNVTSIEEKAFIRCTSLNEVRILGNNVNLDKKAFLEATNVCIYAPLIPIQQIPEPLRLNVAVGFSEMLMNGENLSPQIKDSFLKYLKDVGNVLYKFLCDYDKIFFYMLQEKLIPREDINELLEKFHKANRTDLVIELLEYANSLRNT